MTSCATLSVLWAGGWLWYATNIALSEPTKDQSTTEAIIVLTGGNGRINEGLDLLATKMSEKLFISGVNQDVSKDDIFKSWKNPTTPKPCCIFLGYNAHDTVGNASEVKSWIEENNVKSFRLVTSNYHMTRANLLIKRQLPNIKIIKHNVFSDDFENWKGRFWQLSFSEYNKSLSIWLGLNSK